MFCVTAYWILFSLVHCERSDDDSRPYQEYFSYNGAQLWRADLRTSEDVSLIRRLMNNEDISLWRLTPKKADFLVMPENKIKVYRDLKSKGINHTVVIIDVQRRINAQTIQVEEWDTTSLRFGHRMNWNRYPTVEVIYEYLSYLTKTYPSLCKQYVIGHSTENETIMMFKISNGNPSNKGMILIAGLHAREWIAIASLLVILRELATKYDEQPRHIKDKDWYIIPLLNPDGYRYTYTRDRLWRKNRRQFGNCYGVDINRNFDAGGFKNGFSETNECKEVFGGPNPFSEPESRALRKLVLNNNGRISASIDFHSYGQLIIYPQSSNPEPTLFSEHHNKTVEGMAKAIYARQRRKYSYGHSYSLLYPVTGSLMDWMYNVNINHSYVIETIDKGNFGFLVPPSYIEGVGMELLQAVSYLANVISNQESGQNTLSWF